MHPTSTASIVCLFKPYLTRVVWHWHSRVCVLHAFTIEEYGVQRPGSFGKASWHYRSSKYDIEVYTDQAQERGAYLDQ